MRSQRWIPVVGLLGLGLLPVLSGCDIQEVVAESEENVLVVEAMVHLVRPADPTGSDPVAGSRIQVFLHRTARADGGFVLSEPGARVEVTFPGGEVHRLSERSDRNCAPGSDTMNNGTCYELDDPEGPGSPLMALEGGEVLELRIETAGGGVVTSSTRIPEAFELQSVGSGQACRVAAETTVPVEWSRSASAWAYITETQMFGLSQALQSSNIEVDDDPLFLLGLSLGADDTSTLFPKEFGLIERLRMDPELAEILQKGMPPATRARVSVSAVDRNYVGWIRGSNFHPSGRVRIPSVEGDGTGFFGASVSHWFEVFVEPLPPELQAGLGVCAAGETSPLADAAGRPAESS